MHTDILYTGTQSEKDKAALEDIEGWLSRRRFCQVTNEFVAMAMHSGLSQERLAAVASFGGIQGYPTWAWFREVARLVHKHTD